jgi:UDP:flavonoid glycosyltransferase YjiC (YdhE family)
VSRRILFATSNGTGLGHLNRAMAIARRLPEGTETRIFTLSQAVPAVVGAGFRVDYHPSYRRPASGSDWQWNLRLRRRFESLLAEAEPDLVVFDGVHPYRAITHVLSRRGAPASLWCRRPLWRPGSSAAPLRRTAAFDAVLEPGELAAELDAGPTVARRSEAAAVDPIVLLDPGELLDREQAAAELRLDPSRPTALVNLGQGGAVDRAVERSLASLSAAPELQVAALQSSIAADLEVPADVVHLRATFPMSRYLRAFDLAVAAAGYNSFHELIAFGVPSLFVPMPRLTDDQAARARWAESAGCGIAVAGPDDPALERQLERLLDPAERERIAAACARRFPANGATAAARIAGAMAAGERPAPRIEPAGPLRRWLHLSSHPVGPSLPLALGLTARDLLRHPERRRPQGVLLAFEVPEGELAGELARALADLGSPPERTLVVTDSLELAALRAAGVGFHRLPSPAELGLAPGDPAYAEVIDAGVERALVPWRGSWELAHAGRWYERGAAVGEGGDG